MKFLHIADVHLSIKPETFLSWKALSEVIDCCNRNSIDLLLIAGDLFQNPPLIEELKRLNTLFERLKITKVVMIAGNHDYITTDSNYLKFLFAENVNLLGLEEMDSIYFKELHTQVYGFSYYSKELLQPRLSNAAPKERDRINILLAHGGEENYLPFDLGQLEQAGFDYVALGHIHKPQVLSKRIAYAGSLQPLNEKETGEHGYFMGILTKTKPDSFGESSSKLDLQFISCCTG